MKRSDGERLRLQHAIAHARGALDSVELGMSFKGGAIGTEVAQTLTISAIAVAMNIAKYDAFILAESDAKGTTEVPDE